MVFDGRHSADWMLAPSHDTRPMVSGDYQLRDWRRQSSPLTGCIGVPMVAIIGAGEV